MHHREYPPLGITSDEWGNTYFAERIAPQKLHLIKYDPRGNTEWNTVYEFPSNMWLNHVYDIITDDFGNTYISLVNCSDNGTNYFILKFDKTGRLEWKISQFGYQLLLDTEGNVYSVNQYPSVTKYTPQGEELWTYVTEQNVRLFLKAVTIDRSGNIYLTPQKSPYGYWDFSRWSYLKLIKLIQTENDFIVIPNVAELQLGQNFPNPFNQQTMFKYTLPDAGDVTLTLYNNLGQEVLKQSLGPKGKGNHVYHFSSGLLASGIYYYRIQSGDFHDVKKMALLR